MKVTAFVTHSDCSRHDPGWGHPEHQGRLPAVARAVYRDMLTLFEPLLEVEARPASVADLALAHTAEHIERVRRRAQESERVGRSLPLAENTLLSGASWDAARAAAGAPLTAVEAVLRGEVRNAFCAVRPPGHRARADAAEGFGLFNNVAVAALYLREMRGLERVLVVEWGARPGRGTAEILAGDPGIRFLSVHQEEPADAAPLPRGTYPVPLPAGTGGAEYLRAFESALDAALADFRPDFILLSAGFDALEGDPLGGLALHPEDFHALTVALRERADRLCGGRLVSVLEGGYDPPAMGRAVVQHLRALAGVNG